MERQPAKLLTKVGRQSPRSVRKSSTFHGRTRANAFSQRGLRVYELAKIRVIGNAT